MSDHPVRGCCRVHPSSGGGESGTACPVLDFGKHQPQRRCWIVIAISSSIRVLRPEGLAIRRRIGFVTSQAIDGMFQLCFGVKLIAI